MNLKMISAFSDNYFYVLEENSKIMVVDPGSSKEVFENTGHVDYILCTHHHSDHIGGVKEIKNRFPECRVVGLAKDSYRIPLVDILIEDEQKIEIAGLEIRAMYTPGHTLGHVCYYIEKLKILFCGDTLFSLGCGRLFEGTAEQMFESLQKLSALPDDTIVCCAHEYTLSNAKFLESLGNLTDSQKDYINEVKGLREKGLKTIPSTIGKEKWVNPFLRAKTVEEFAELRRRKDLFN